ncbi:MAG: carboxylating nicotinate-nucleotide diphosphorylase [Firmicutes bacterium]|nr:carboxylating nicotinate-nucleotide diphosphorylase [Bacillota bacterium]
MSTAPFPEPLDWDAPILVTMVRAALEEDLGTAGDITTNSIVPPDATACAHLLARQPVVLAGLPLAERAFRALDGRVLFHSRYADGQTAAAGEVFAELAGPARAILSAERTALNFLAHLSGIASLTRRFVEALTGTRARIRDTRKTTPLLRQLEKYAVRVGGGSNHRFGLYDAVLIKENHIALAGSLTTALHRARERAPALARPIPARPATAPPAVSTANLVIQVEVRTEAELREALAAGADAVLLDNVTPEEARHLVALVRAERPQCIVEVSGGITLANVRAYAEAGVDFIAAGALTHSAPAADLSLLVE